MRDREVYPKPGPVGARLIRACIAGLREAGLKPPVQGPLFLAVSGGADSLALAHLLAHYGRRVVARDGLILAHVDHGWRGEESTEDARFVAACARRWGVGFAERRLEAQDRPRAGESWEERAREARHAWFESLVAREGGWVLTAHHADDLAETLLWRLGTGSVRTHGGGIARRTGVLVRPLLRVRKRELQAYLEETGQKHREDRTNRDDRFLRNRIRNELLPAFERLFPRVVEHLVREALDAQRVDAGRPTNDTGGIERRDALWHLFGASGLRPRAAHWRALTNDASATEANWATSLPGGWTLRREARSRRPERWVLEARASERGDRRKCSEKREKRD